MVPELEGGGSEIHGHFQIHDKFKASLGHMRCCLKKKKKKDFKMNFLATIPDHGGSESSQSFRLVISLTEKSRVE